MKTKGFSGLITAIVAAVIIIAAGAGIVLWQQTKLPAVEPQPTTPPVPSGPVPSEVEGVEGPTPAPSTPADPTANWKTYRNEQYGFEVRYPTDWSPKELTTRTANPSYYIEIYNSGGYNLRIDPVTKNPDRELCSLDEVTDEKILVIDGENVWRTIRPTLAEISDGRYRFPLFCYSGPTLSGERFIAYELLGPALSGERFDYYLIYELPIGLTDETYNRATVEKMDQILSTFRFI